MKILSGIIGVTAALALTAMADGPNLLVDGSFENGTFTANPISLTGGGQVSAGWATFGNVSQSDMFTSPGYPPEDGTYALLEVNAAGNGWNPAGAYQLVPGTAGTMYYLTAYGLTDTGAQGDWWGTPVDIQIAYFGTAPGNIGPDLVNLGNNDLGWSATGMNTWQHYGVSGVAPAGTEYVGVYLMAMVSGSNAGDVNVYFDNAILETPEPTTLALLGMGLAIPFFVRRKS